MNELYRFINKWIVKIAGAMITAPVTFLIAGQVYADIGSPALRLVLQITAVFLVEGVFLANWISLEADRRAEPAIKALRAVFTILMYAGLWALALQHGEKGAGVVFRLALGFAVVQSIYEAGVWQMVSAGRKADSDIYQTRAVRRAARQAAKNVALREIACRKEQDLLQLDVEHKAAVEGVRLYGRRVLQDVKAEGREASENVSDLGRSDIERARFAAGRGKRHRQQQVSKREAMQHVLTLLSDNPDMPKSDIAEATNRSRDSVYRYLTELEEAGRIVRSDTGSGYRVEANNGFKA